MSGQASDKYTHVPSPPPPKKKGPLFLGGEHFFFEMSSFNDRIALKLTLMLKKLT